MLHIHLHHLFARTSPGVLHIYSDGNRALAWHCAGCHPQIRIRESRIAQAVAERIKWLPFEVHVCAAMANVVVHHRRQLVQRAGPSLHQTSGGIVIAEQYIRERIAFFLTASRPSLGTDTFAHGMFSPPFGWLPTHTTATSALRATSASPAE